VGTWNAVYELISAGRVRQLHRDRIDLPGSAHNNFVDARGKLVALLGVNDLIVVDTADALLVTSRDRAQQVGDVVKALEKSNRHDLL
jgi:mannose-1-phosphate guanylyltransferase